MSDIVKKYSNGEITIIWKPSLCIHSKKCWTGLPHVFNPQEQPWIKTDTEETKIICEQIDKCPSGALSYNHHSTKTGTENKNNHIEITPNGPILVHGDIELTHTDGKKESKEKVTALCRCGASSNKPFCDGSHNKIDFKD